MVRRPRVVGTGPENGLKNMARVARLVISPKRNERVPLKLLTPTFKYVKDRPNVKSSTGRNPARLFSATSKVVKLPENSAPGNEPVRELSSIVRELRNGYDPNPPGIVPLKRFEERSMFISSDDTV